MRKNIMKKWIGILLAICLAVGLMPATAFAANTDSDGFDAGDVAAIQAIINASPTLKGSYNLNDPSTWEANGLVEWNGENPKRATVLMLRFPNGDEGLTDVTDFSGTLNASALLYLEELYCSGNSGLTELSLPTSLKRLSCYKTGIKALDISGCTALEYLECYRTSISALDVSNNPALTYLDCEGTKVSSLALSGLSKLAALYCNSTPIELLDVSKNANLTYLNCWETGIKTINLSSNQSLTTFILPATLEKLVTPDGKTITLTQTVGGKIQLSCENDNGNPIYMLAALEDPDYVLARWNGVTDFIDATTTDEKMTEVKFNITGNMEISANFMEKRLTLASLAVEGATLAPVFSGNVFNYTAEVPYAVTSVKIVAEGWDRHVEGTEEYVEKWTNYKHRITGAGEHALNVGANTFVVTVTVPKDEDSDMTETLTQDYVITVTRQAESAPTPTPAPTPTGELDDVPKTGDDSNMSLWLGLMMIALAGLAACLIAWRRKQTN